MRRTRGRSVDVTVIGGGPAGATAGRLLASWGHSVAILARPPGRHSLAESLPPSIRKILAHVGALRIVEGACFIPARGNTAWWDDLRGRSESFAGEAGYQVLRRDFDRLLLREAVMSGARLAANASVRRVDLELADAVLIEYAKSPGKLARLRARFVLDCSGRAGVIARRFRVKDSRLTTVALSGVWRCEAGFPGVDETHTLVEAYRDGWAWSVPLSRELRHVAAMVDPHPARGTLGGSAARYRAELAKTSHVSRLVEGAILTETPWACDASVYGARAFGGPRFLLVGDAASFLDPMSSFGVKKALASAWMAAVVANTCLRHPERTQAALELFSRSEHEMAATYARGLAPYVRGAASRHQTPFWTRRAQAQASAAAGEDSRDPAIQAAFDDLRRHSSLRLRIGEGVRFDRVGEVRGREVVLAEAVASPSLPSGVRHVRGVELPSLVRIAPEHDEVPRLFEAYNRASSPVGLPAFLAALSFLLARGVLKSGL